MPNYMLFLHSDSTRPRPSSPDEVMAITKAYMAWADRMRAEGRLKGGEKLTYDAGKVMRPNGGGRVTVTDGPYAETKDIVGGYTLIEARDLDQAVELSKGCPIFESEGGVEVRPIMKMDM